MNDRGGRGRDRDRDSGGWEEGQIGSERQIERVVCEDGGEREGERGEQR